MLVAEPGDDRRGAVGDPHVAEPSSAPGAHPVELPLSAQDAGSRLSAEIPQHAGVVVRIGTLKQLCAPQRGLPAADVRLKLADQTLRMQRDVARRRQLRDVARHGTDLGARARHPMD